MIHRPPKLRGYQATPDGIYLPERGRNGNVCAMGMGSGMGHGIDKPVGGTPWNPSDLGSTSVFDFGAEFVDASPATTLYDQSPAARTALIQWAPDACTIAADPVLNNRLTIQRTGLSMGYYRVVQNTINSGYDWALWLVGNNLDNVTLNQVAGAENLGGAKPYISLDSIGQLGYKIGTTRVQEEVTPLGPMARVWEFNGAVSETRLYSPAGLIFSGVQGPTRWLNNINPTYIIGQSSTKLKNFNLGRVTCVNSLDPGLRANWFAWCASYYNVTT